MFYHCINATKLPNRRLLQPQIPLITMNYCHLPQNAVSLTHYRNNSWPLNNRFNKTPFLFLDSSHSSNVFFPPGYFRVILGFTFQTIFSSNYLQLFSRMLWIRLILVLIEDVMMTMIFLQLGIILIEHWVHRIDQDFENTFVMATWKWIISSYYYHSRSWNRIEFEFTWSYWWICWIRLNLQKWNS